MTEKSKLVRVRTKDLQNEVHFRFHTENEKLYRMYEPNVLGINTLLPAYQQALKDEDEALERIRKSSDTPRIADADQRFDRSYQSLRYQHLSYLHHNKPDLRRAAENLEVIFHQYGNIGKQAYRKQLALSYNFVQELRKHEDDIKKLNLTVWVNEHELAQEDLATLLDERAHENAHKTELRTNEVRAVVDTVYHQITDTIDVMILLKGRDYAPGFFAAFNEHATEYKRTLAQHMGVVHKHGDKEETDD